MTYKGEKAILWKTTFSHVYDAYGFNISGKFTSDGKDYKAPSKHTCLKHGYWCISNLKEYPLDLLVFLKIKIRRLFKI